MGVPSYENTPPLFPLARAGLGSVFRVRLLRTRLVFDVVILLVMGGKG